MDDKGRFPRLVTMLPFVCDCVYNSYYFHAHTRSRAALATKDQSNGEQTAGFAVDGILLPHPRGGSIRVLHAHIHESGLFGACRLVSRKQRFHLHDCGLFSVWHWKHSSLVLRRYFAIPGESSCLPRVRLLRCCQLPHGIQLRPQFMDIKQCGTTGDLCQWRICCQH